MALQAIDKLSTKDKQRSSNRMFTDGVAFLAGLLIPGSSHSNQPSTQTQ
jgi:hypothetical protein